MKKRITALLLTAFTLCGVVIIPGVPNASEIQPSCPVCTEAGDTYFAPRIDLGHEGVRPR